MKHIGWIALGGISVGVIAGGLAMASGAKEFSALAHSGLADLSRWSNFDWTRLDHDPSCRGYKTVVDGPERRIQWDGSDNVIIAVSANVTYRAGDGADVVIKGDPETIARVRLREGKLEWCGRGRRGDIEIALPGREFRNLTLAGSGDVSMTNMAQSDINFTIAGSGTIRATGNIDRISVTIAGSGDALLGGVDAKRLDVKIAGSGNTEAAPQDDADVTIMGSGNVKLLTKPAHLTTNIMGSGRVTQEPEGTVKKSSAALAVRLADARS